MKTRLSVPDVLFLLALMSSTAWAASNVSFSQSVETVDAYDFVEVTLNVDKPDARNPFLDVAVTASFAKTDGSERKTVEGFCDSGDGTVFRIRFMPASPGDYTWSASRERVPGLTTSATVGPTPFVVTITTRRSSRVGNIFGNVCVTSS